MKRFTIIIFFISVWSYATAQQKTVQERLGYPKDTRLLIIHADDMGVSHSENIASIHAMEKGVVNSGSIMVPCPWFPEIVEYAKAHPEADLGLHLTLNSEWKYYKWGPVTPLDQVKSLLDEKGYLYDNTAAVIRNAKADEVERELRAQIDRAIQSGIDPTHFDAHMGTAFAKPEFFQALIKLGREYKVPVMVSREFAAAFNIDINKLINEKEVVLDRVIIAGGDDYRKGMGNFYTNALKSIKPGLTCLLLHAAYDNDEMKAVTIDHIDYGSAWRQADFDFFTSERCKKILADEKIKLITWKEIRDRLYR